MTVNKPKIFKITSFKIIFHSQSLEHGDKIPILLCSTKTLLKGCIVFFFQELYRLLKK